MGRKGAISQDELNRLVFKVNSHITPGQGSALLGDKVLAQNMKPRKWTIRGEVVDSREADDGSTRSFVIRTENGRSTLRNARHLKFQALKKSVTFADNIGENTEHARSVSNCSTFYPRPCQKLPAVDKRQLRNHR